MAGPGDGRLNGLEDFEPGRRFLHHWGRTVTESDAITFATQTHQYQPALFDAVYAEHLGLRGSPVSELLTYAVVLGLSVEDLSESGGSFLGSDDIEFIAPVLVGDTLFSSSVVVSRRESASRPGWGVVTWRTTGTNQHGTVVVRFVRSSLVRRQGEDSGSVPATTSTGAPSC